MHGHHDDKGDTSQRPWLMGGITVGAWIQDILLAGASKGTFGVFSSSLEEAMLVGAAIGTKI